MMDRMHLLHQLTKPTRRRPRHALWTLACILALTLAARAVETPKSYGEPASYENAVVRIPMTEEAPTIDGVMEEGEWEDSSALSGFWYDFAQADPRFLASHHIQPRIHLSYDKDYMYVCFDNPVYPENSWLKARGRFPDVLHHPQYGLLWDDHMEFELRPHPKNTEGFNLGLLRWDVNAISNLVDWCWTKTKGEDRTWDSKADVSAKVGDKRWIVEMAIPFEALRYAGYADNDEDGEPYVKIPPPDGSVYRFWFHQGIGGNGAYSLHFDKHNFMVTEGEFIFDSKAPSFQITELGEIMDDVINLELRVKNHSSRSETVRLGFFVENPAGNIYSSYNSPELSDGLLELRPGEVRTVRLRQPFPGISRDGNVLWFDVRSAGRPSKILYRTRLQDFHSMDGGRVLIGERLVTYPERRLEPIDDLRPAKEDFRIMWDYTPITQKVSCIMDTDVHGASEEAQSAVEAKVTVEENVPDGKVLAEETVPFNGPFAVAILQLPKDLEDGLELKMTTILFDENKRIMGERSIATTGSSKRPEPWVYLQPEWLDNEIGLEDRVWEPFTPIEKTDDGFETLKHSFAIADSGLPEQIRIKPDPRELPFDKRGEDAELADDFLMRYGRGPQLAAPIRFEGVVDGERVQAEVVKPAELVREWESEFEYESTIRVGSVVLDIKTIYDCDGSLDVHLDYGPDGNAADIELLELVTEFDGAIDLVNSGTRGGMAGADVLEISIPEKEGVVWDSKDTHMELFYSKFIPWLWLGSGDRGFTWTSNSDRGWYLDKTGSSMLVERDGDGRITWRVKLVNHPVTIEERKSTWFGLLVHPAKPKPEKYRTWQWHFLDNWATGYMGEPLLLPEEKLKDGWRKNSKAPDHVSFEEVREWQLNEQDEFEPPWTRYGQWRNVGVTPEIDDWWEQKATYAFERQIRVGRRVGGWMDEYWPGFSKSNNLAAESAYMRDPETVEEDELPWQAGWNIDSQRNVYKRFNRVFKREGVPNRHAVWANNQATMLESLVWETILVEGAGAAQPSREVDVLTQFPNSLYTYLGHSWTGLIVHLFPDQTPVAPGDDRHFDRAWLGQAMLQDFGVVTAGPHGTLKHTEQGMRLIEKLHRFGFFKHGGVHRMPFWRNQDIVQLGGDEPHPNVHVTAYKTPLEDGKGYRTILAILNCHPTEPVELPVVIKDAERLLGGSNTLNNAEVMDDVDVPESMKQLWGSIRDQRGGTPALRDFETGELIEASDEDGNEYGPVYLPFHGLRILYAEHRQE